MYELSLVEIVSKKAQLDFSKRRSFGPQSEHNVDLDPASPCRLLDINVISLDADAKSTMDIRFGAKSARLL